MMARCKAFGGEIYFMCRNSYLQNLDVVDN